MDSLVVVVMVARATKAAAVVRWEEALSADELAPRAHQDRTDHHTQNRDADAGDNTDQDRQDDVRGELAEEQGPAVLAVVRHLVAADVMTVVVVGVCLSAVASLDAHHARAAVHLHLLQLGGDDGAPLAEDGGALLLLLVHRGGGGLGCGLLDLGDKEVVPGRLDQVDTDVGKAVDEYGADLDNLEVDDDELETLVGGLDDGLNLQAEAKLLLDRLGRLALVWAELVVALKLLGILCGVLLVLVVVLVMVPGLLGDLSCDENVCEGVGVGVQLEAVDRQLAGLSGEVELEMAIVLLVVGFLWFAVVLLLEDGRAPSALEVDGLGLGDR